MIVQAFIPGGEEAGSRASLPSIEPCLQAGVDEVGRGPLAGPVVAAAVILDPCQAIDGLADSKTLSASRREQLAATIKQRAIAFAVAWADVAEIDSVNILQATFLAMRRAVFRLPVVPSILEVDGNKLPDLEFYGNSIQAFACVGGDATHPSISAASILAKVYRDRWMSNLDSRYPGYGFARHKGYPTAAHRQVIAARGPCLEHRRSFKPVARFFS